MLHADRATLMNRYEQVFVMDKIAVLFAERKLSVEHLVQLKVVVIADGLRSDAHGRLPFMVLSRRQATSLGFGISVEEGASSSSSARRQICLVTMALGDHPVIGILEVVLAWRL